MQDPERRPLPRPRRRKEEPAYEEEEHINTNVEDDGDLSLALPAHGLFLALLIGFGASLVMVFIHFLIRLLNAQTFRLAALQGIKMSDNTALTVANLSCLLLFLALVICSFAGYLVGRYAVQRHLGFLAGLIAGAGFYLFTFASTYIPAYPGNAITPMLAPATPLLLVFALISGCGGGLVSLLVTWLTTRRHPYYAKVLY